LGAPDSPLSGAPNPELRIPIGLLLFYYMVRLPNAVLLGSVSNDDGNGNEEAKKAIGLASMAKQQLCTCITLFCAFLYRERREISRFMEDRNTRHHLQLRHFILHLRILKFN